MGALTLTFKVGAGMTANRGLNRNAWLKRKLVQAGLIDWTVTELLSGEPDYFGRNKISSGGDRSHYSSASLY